MIYEVVVPSAPQENVTIEDDRYAAQLLCGTLAGTYGYAEVFEDGIKIITDARSINVPVEEVAQDP